MHITVLTLFPQMFSGPFDYSIVKRAKEKNLVSIDIVSIRDFALDSYKSVDDRPYGGGAGMILRVDIVDRALQSLKNPGHIILLDPTGVPYTQKKATSLSKATHLTFICGHYEGVDERVRSLVDESISIGDYITTGGELPTMVIVDSVVRLLPGALGDSTSSVDESFSENRLEYPQYTRPEVYNNLKVPEVLLSGNHKLINTWKKEESKKRTQEKRPDLSSK